MPPLTRRDTFSAIAAAAALHVLWQSKAIAGGPPEALDKWAQDIADANRDLAAGSIGLLDWQNKIAAFHAAVDIKSVAEYLDFDRVTAAMQFPDKLARTIDPKFPERINVGGIERKWFIRFFGMKKGGAIIPHVHNNMVSSHLIVSGAFHARTFDRAADMPGFHGNAVMLRPNRDEIIQPGGALTMSDDRDNCHWLIAEADRSFTFDVGVLEISKTRTYVLPANEYSMIFVDPTAEPDGYGMVRAPTLTFDECCAKFAA